jgi:hypothetical protein
VTIAPLWLARAIGTQIVIDRLRADLRPEEGRPLLLDDDRSQVIALHFVADSLDLVVRRELVTYRLAVAAAVQAGTLSHASAPEALALRACPQRRR